MSEYLDNLNERVSEAIFRAEHAADPLEAEAAFREVSGFEEEIARITPAAALQGSLARIGAVTAALRAGDWLRAAQLAECFASGAPDDLTQQLQALAHDAETASRGTAEPDVRPISFDLRAA
jgi:hypothetical protein